MRAWIKGALALGVAAAALSMPASASHSWGGYHWSKGSGELAVAVGDNVSSVWDPYLQLAVNGANVSVDGTVTFKPGWNQSTVIQSPLRAGSSDPRRCRAVAGTIQVCNNTYGRTGWLGIASIWLSGGHISQGTTKLNDTYYNTAQYNTPAWRRLVMCQEIAHDYGLDHQDEEFGNANLGSCMDYTNAPGGGGSYGPSNEYPNAHDWDMLLQVYNHSHGAMTTMSAQSAQGFADDGISGDTPREWGRAVRTDRHGRPDMFVLDFGGGRRKITHVFWAPGEGPARH